MSSTFAKCRPQQELKTIFKYGQLANLDAPGFACMCVCEVESVNLLRIAAILINVQGKVI